MEDKIIVATLYLKDGRAVLSPEDDTEPGDVYELCRLYNDSGIDKIIIFDLSEDEEERGKNLEVIRNINRRLDIKVCAGGNIRRIEDVKKLLVAGCMQVMLNGSKPQAMEIAKEASSRFGKDHILVSVENVDFIFKNQDRLPDTFHELLLMKLQILDSVENITNVPYVVVCDSFDFENLVGILKRTNVRGIAGSYVNDPETDIMRLKSNFSDAGIKMDNFTAELKWSDLKLNSDGLIPVIVQNYRTDEVLMLAYMDEEAFDTTIRIGKMTYHSRSRNELWTKGLTSGHIQYVKSLTADCDYDTILAKVEQVGGIACHTGSRSCFFNEIVKKEYIEKNLLNVLESIYKIISNRKENPMEGTYTNYLFEHGEDKMLKHLGEKCTEVIIAAKNTENPDAIKYEIADLMYSIMILMVEKGITWEELTTEFAPELK